jgi:hypothetical protein
MKQTVWLARDNDGDLYIHFAKPVEDYVSPSFWRSSDYVNVSNTSLDKKFESVLPGSAPIECSVETTEPN